MDRSSRGFNIIELVIAIAILVILISVGVSTFLNTKDNKILEQSTLLVESILNETRAKAVAGGDNNVHGVHFTSTTLTIFIGNSYNSSDPDNEVIDLDEGVEITDIDFNGGDDVVFLRLKGTTMDDGTAAISLVKDSANKRFINVSETGIISLD